MLRDRKVNCVVFVIIPTLIGIALFGYFIMGRLDAFFAKGGFNDSPLAKVDKKLLIYCARQAELLLDKLEPELQRQGIRCGVLTEPHVPPSDDLLAVLALSARDLDNLLLCHEAKHLRSDIYTIALCNDRLYQHFFADAGIDQILTENQPADYYMAQISRLVLTYRQAEQITQETGEKKCG